MRKLSWMAVIVVAGGGLIGVTRFTGMWGRGDEAEHAGGGVTSQWQSFEVPGQYDGVVDLKAVADGGIRALPRSRMALEPEETETIVLQGVEPVGTTAMDRTAAATASSTFGDMEDLQREGFADSVEEAVYVEPVAAAEPDVMFEPEEMMPEPEPMAAEDPYMDVEPAMAESEYAAMDTYGEMDYMTAADMELDVEAEMGYAREEFVEYPTVVEAQEVDMRGGEMVATMSVMGAAEGAEDWPPQSYDPEPTHTYVVSPPLAWADEREPVALPRLAGERVVARPQQTDTRERGGLRGVIDVSYVSRFIWRGYDVYANNHSAFQPSIDLDLFGTGFGLNVWMSRANGSGFEDTSGLPTRPITKVRSSSTRHTRRTTRSATHISVILTRRGRVTRCFRARATHRRSSASFTGPTCCPAGLCHRMRRLPTGRRNRKARCATTAAGRTSSDSPRTSRLRRSSAISRSRWCISGHTWCTTMHSAWQARRPIMTGRTPSSAPRPISIWAAASCLSPAFITSHRGTIPSILPTSTGRA